MRTILFMFFVFSFAVTSSLRAQSGWQLAREQDGIRLYVRWVDAGENRKVRQMRAEMQVNATAGDLLTLLRDDENGADWVNRAAEFYHFDRRDDFLWHTYTELSIPWPFSNRDMVTRNELRVQPETGAFRIDLRGAAGHLPPRKNTVRILHFEGAWEVTPSGAEQARVSYEIVTKSDSFLPRSITDPIVEKGFISTMAKLRAIATDGGSQGKVQTAQVRQKDIK
jgi:hypothetical protein